MAMAAAMLLTMATMATGRPALYPAPLGGQAHRRCPPMAATLRLVALQPTLRSRSSSLAPAARHPAAAAVARHHRRLAGTMAATVIIMTAPIIMTAATTITRPREAALAAAAAARPVTATAGPHRPAWLALAQALVMGQELRPCGAQCLARSAHHRRRRRLAHAVQGQLVQALAVDPLTWAWAWAVAAGHV